MPKLREFQGLEGQNFFEDDRGFHVILSTLAGADRWPSLFESLSKWGSKVGGTWNGLAAEASRVENLPRIEKEDRVGREVQRVALCESSRELRRQVGEFGVLDRNASNLTLFAIVYLLAHNGEASVNCGLSCTDGLIRAIETKGSDFLRKQYLPLLRSLETPLAGAQFVTEQDGGSDVGAIETSATLNSDGSWSLSGEKWFCSNPIEYFLVAARPRNAQPGTAGLAVFLVPRVLPDGTLNTLSFRRLKNKLGTQSLPTAEIDFHDAKGWAIGPVEDGFKTLMTYVINVSRIHNAANACGFLHRAFLEARNYARQREVFGATLISSPLLRQTLIGLLEQLWRYRLLTFKLVNQIDRNGLAPADPNQAIWQRFLINLAKYRTGVTLTNSIREAILILGGNGIVEDFSVLPRLLRDSMIIETWEGPHNTLCLQIVRDAARSSLIARWRSEIAGGLEQWPAGFLPRTRQQIEDAFQESVKVISRERFVNARWTTTHARGLVDRMGALLELIWMAELARSRPATDCAGALLTAAAAFNLLGGNVFEHPVHRALEEHGLDLVEEREFLADLAAL